jgi:hypothetical protein
MAAQTPSTVPPTVIPTVRHQTVCHQTVPTPSPSSPAALAREIPGTHHSRAPPPCRPSTTHTRVSFFTTRTSIADIYRHRRSVDPARAAYVRAQGDSAIQLKARRGPHLHAGCTRCSSIAAANQCGGRYASMAQEKRAGGVSSSARRPGLDEPETDRGRYISLCGLVRVESIRREYF